MYWIGVFIAILTAPIYFICTQERKISTSTQSQLQLAKNEYEKALEALKINGCKKNKIQLLEAGRRYAAIARKQAGGTGVALFDEVALQNDLTAYSD